MSLHSANNKLSTLVCWICLDVNCRNKVNLVEGSGWLEMFEFCLGLPLTTQAASQILCGNCAEKLKSYAKFKDQCIKADKHWKSISSNVSCHMERIKLDKDIKTENPQLLQDISDCIENNVKIELSPSSLNNFDIYEDNKVIILTADDHSNETYFDEDIDNINVEYTTGAQEEKCNLNQSNSENVKKPRLIKNDILNPKKEVVKCKMCKKTYTSKKWLKTHLKSCKNQSKEKKINIRKLQNENYVFKCGLCESTYTNFENLSQHLDGHWSSNDLNCKLCDFVALDLAHLLTHRYLHMSNEKIRFTCHICKVTTWSVRSLQFHYRATHLNKPGGLCSHCKKEFNSIIHWSKHERSHRAAFICDYCGKKFPYKHCVVEHIATHTDWSKYICETCGKSFKRARNLKLHIKNVHEESEPIKCLHCNRIFKSQYTYSKHQKHTTAVRVLKCDVCHKGFANSRLLKLHMIWHSDERPYSCHICGSGYKAKSQLKIHMRSHTGDMPYKCEHCPRSFASCNQLKVHTSVHTGVRKYKCHCGRSFHSKKLLHDHCLLRHKDDVDN